MQIHSPRNDVNKVANAVCNTAWHIALSAMPFLLFECIWPDCNFLSGLGMLSKLFLRQISGECKIAMHSMNSKAKHLTLLVSSALLPAHLCIHVSTKVPA